MTGPKINWSHCAYRATVLEVCDTKPSIGNNRCCPSISVGTCTLNSNSLCQVPHKVGWTILLISNKTVFSSIADDSLAITCTAMTVVIAKISSYRDHLCVNLISGGERAHPWICRCASTTEGTRSRAVKSSCIRWRRCCPLRRRRASLDVYSALIQWWTPVKQLW